jgi:hypothetical protein
MLVWLIQPRSHNGVKNLAPNPGSGQYARLPFNPPLRCAVPEPAQQD